MIPLYADPVKRAWIAVGVLFGLVVFVSNCGGGDTPPVSRGTAVVTLDAFSGVPNPTWALDAETAAELVSTWESHTITTEVEYPGTLGYRGLIVDFADGSRLWVSSGVAIDTAQDQTIARADRERIIELWLLSTGETSIEPTMYESLVTQISAPTP